MSQKMKIWKNTSTLDGFDDGLIFCKSRKEASIALIGSKSINLSDFPKLKGIFKTGISKDNVPEKEAKELGIKVGYPSSQTHNVIIEETASFTCGLILKMIYKKVGTIDPWVKNPRGKLSKKKLLVIGNGKIGKIVARLMKNFMIVKSYDVLTNSEKELKNLISESDCITIHIPKTKKNISFFDKEKLSWMKNGSILINTARGPIVNEEDLYNELIGNRIFAAFDVFWDEPYVGKLKEFHPSFFSMTPHVASTCSDFLKGCRKDLDLFINEIL